jgi:predicted MPP superfamily phosphohydrolase
MAYLKQLTFFIAISAIIFGSIHYYVYSKLVYYFDLNNISPKILAGILIVLCGLLVFAMPLGRFLPKNITTIFSGVIFTWMGIIAILTMVILLADIIRIFIYPLINAGITDNLFRKIFSIAILTLTCSLSVYAFYSAIGMVKVKEVSIKLEKLPPDLGKFSIIQLTDIHVGYLIKGEWLKKIVTRVNSLDADIVVITGDLVDGSVKDLAQHVQELQHLKSKHGVYFVTGNHEYYSGVEEWVEYLATLGIKVLRNERVTINKNQKAAFELAGVDDFHSKNANMHKALNGRNRDLALILLAHQPAAIKEASIMGVDLQLSGHTHGGQIWPFNFAVKLQQPFVSGLHFYKDTSTQIYISKGTGYWGPPMRLGASAEITKINIKP